MKKMRLKVAMHCPSCALTISKQLKKIAVEAEINPVLKIVDCTYDQSKTSPSQIIKAIKKTGYKILEIDN